MKLICSFLGQPLARLGHLNGVLCGAALMALLVPAVVRASDPTGIYAYVDRVVFEPSDAAPDRIQVWGGFALAKKTPTRLEYNDPERGYMYFKLRPGDEEVCKKEWADLKSVAGKQQIVAFGSRDAEPQPTIRKSNAKPENPDVHPKGFGMTKVDSAPGNRNSRAPLDQLKEMATKPAAESKSAPATKASEARPATKSSGN
jgi:hypothetical protein